MITEPTIKTARSVQKMYGSNYHVATLLLPKDIRISVFIFYAFLRLADELVDNPLPNQNPEIAIHAFEAEWQRAYQTGQSDNDIFLAWREIMLLKQVDQVLIEDFFAAMKQDLFVERYETYEDLQGYMYGSAEIVGMILTKLFGCTDPNAIPYARKLGEAMQFANFLRDIYEDKVLRDRIYLPQEDLREFNVTETALTQQICTLQIKELLRFECERAHRLFSKAKPGIELLPKSVQPAVRAAAALYEEIVYELGRRDYCVQSTKIKFTTWEKLKIALIKGYVKTN